MSNVQRAGNRPDRTKSERVPLGQRDRLTFDNLEAGYVYRVINDSDDRLARAQKAGYEFVGGDGQLGDVRAGEGGKIDSRISKPVGNNTRGFLMRIKEDWYKEDQAEKIGKIEETEKSMKPDKAAGQYGSGLTNE
jgi:hypothetical protein